MEKYTKEYYLNTNKLPTMWCPGCGSGIVLGSIVRALERLQINKEDVVIATGIGCWGKGDDYFKTNGFHGTHGRCLSFATGIKAGNPNLKVIALMGDGDGSTIGGNHLIHTARRNFDITAIIVNNLNYGMTGGQYSATTPHGKKTITSKLGNPERPFDLCELVKAAGANYVARGDVYHVNQLDNLIYEAISKKGFSMVEAISVCPTHFGKLNKMGEAPEMLKTIGAACVNQKQYDLLSDEDKEGKYIVGVIANRDNPDFISVYDSIRNENFKEDK